VDLPAIPRAAGGNSAIDLDTDAFAISQKQRTAGPDASRLIWDFESMFLSRFALVPF
jgi:hypothetical protein